MRHATAPRAVAAAYFRHPSSARRGCCSWGTCLGERERRERRTAHPGVPTLGGERVVSPVAVRALFWHRQTRTLRYPGLASFHRLLGARYSGHRQTRPTRTDPAAVLGWPHLWPPARPPAPSPSPSPRTESALRAFPATLVSPAKHSLFVPFPPQLLCSHPQSTPLLRARPRPSAAGQRPRHVRKARGQHRHQFYFEHHRGSGHPGAHFGH